MSPAPRKKGATCSVQGCTTAAKARGMCAKHGNKRCSRSGCATAAQADTSGLCNRHGGGHRCVTPGCAKNVTRNNRCIRHQPTSFPGCSQIPQSKGITKRHSSNPCTMSGCTTLARSNGLCTRHGGGRCVVPDCTTCAFRGGRCKQHMMTQPPPAASPSYLPAIERMKALTDTPQYSGPSWLEVCAMLHRAHHLQPTPLVAASRIHATQTRLPEPIESDHVMVEGFGILVSDSPGPGPSPLQ